MRLQYQCISFQCVAVGLHMNTVGGNTLIFVSPGQFEFKYLHALFYIYD